jgi:hypothetical protein
LEEPLRWLVDIGSTKLRPACPHPHFIISISFNIHKVGIGWVNGEEGRRRILDMFVEITVSWEADDDVFPGSERRRI